MLLMQMHDLLNCICFVVANSSCTQQNTIAVSWPVGISHLELESARAVVNCNWGKEANHILWEKSHFAAN